MLQDLRFGFKLLWKEKAFTVTALLTLALCIGANTAIFSVLHAVILAPLPFPESDRLVSMGNIYPGVGITKNVQNAHPRLLRPPQDDGRLRIRRPLQPMPASMPAPKARPSASRPTSSRRPSSTSCAPRPMMGRLFTEDDAVFEKNQFVILSYGLWKEMFAHDSAILGRDVRLSGVNYRVVGVMPEGFSFPGREARLWVPLTWAARQTTDDARHSNNWDMIARLQPGVTVAAAQQRIDALNRHNIENSGKLRKLLEDARFATIVTSLKDELVGDVRPTLYPAAMRRRLRAAHRLRERRQPDAGALQHSHEGTGHPLQPRRRPRAPRHAVAHRGHGARRDRRHSAACSPAPPASACWNSWARPICRAARPSTMDGTVLAFSAAIAVLTGLVFGSVPVYHLVRRDLNAVFRSTERTGTTEKRALWTRSALVVCQVSLAFVLLIGSGLLTLSFARLLAVDPGFQAQNVQTAQFSLPRSRYKEDAQLRNFLGPLLEDIRAIPGVAAAGATDSLPFGGNVNASALAVEGYNPASGELPPVPNWSHIDAGYLPAMRIPLRAGRYFREGDTADSPKVVIVDEFLARKYWPAGNAIGGHIRGGIEAEDAALHRGRRRGQHQDRRSGRSESRAAPSTSITNRIPPRTVHVVVKTAAADAQAVAAVRAALLKADPEVPLFDVKTMPERVIRFGARSQGRHGHLPGLRAARARAFRHRHLRRARLHRRPAHARVRHPHGARRHRRRRGRHGR